MSPTSPVSLVARLARKELREILRDRRTIITLVLMPVLLYPLLSVGLRQYFLSTDQPEEATVYRIGFGSELEAKKFDLMLPPVKGDNKPELNRFVTQDLLEGVRDGDVDLGIVVSDPAEPLDPAKTVACEFIVRDDSALGLRIADHLKERLSEANVRLLQARLFMRGVPDPARPIVLTTRVIPRVEGKKSSILSTLVPLILV